MGDAPLVGDFYYAILCANETIMGIVTRDKRVLSDTIPTERDVSLLYLVANMVVFAAVGALQEIMVETRSAPRIPHR